MEALGIIVVVGGIGLWIYLCYYTNRLAIERYGYNSFRIPNMVAIVLIALAWVALSIFQDPAMESSNLNVIVMGAAALGGTVAYSVHLVRKTSVGLGLGLAFLQIMSAFALIFYVLFRIMLAAGLARDNR